MRSSIGAALFMAVLLLLYIVLAGVQGVRLVAFGEPITVAMGIALLVIPLIGLWALYRELSFGFTSQKLVAILDGEGLLPVDTLDKRPSGRPVRDQADAEFDGYRAEVEADSDSWRSWFRLGLAYDASGDRKRARAAIRTAIKLHRSDPRPV